MSPEASKRQGGRPSVPEKFRAGPLLTIHPNDVYSAAGAREALGLTASTIRREVREGRLRVSKRAGRYFLLGAWLLEWIAGGEVRRSGADRGRNGEA
jgi:hypothetical protein